MNVVVAIRSDRRSYVGLVLVVALNDLDHFAWLDYEIKIRAPIEIVEAAQEIDTVDVVEVATPPI